MNEVSKMNATANLHKLKFVASDNMILGGNNFSSENGALSSELIPELPRTHKGSVISEFDVLEWIGKFIENDIADKNYAC